MTLLWERRGEAPEAFPVLAVHDELVVECPEGRAAEWLRRAMADGMAGWLALVPVVVEAAAGPAWR
jgi:DNA polymerase-1